MALVLSQVSSSILDVLKEILTSPFYILLLIFSIVVICRFLFSKSSSKKEKPNIPNLPPMKKRDMTIDELKEFDGKKGDNRICVAVNGKIFDVTEKGSDIYGPGGPYSCYAGRDASRGLALFSLDKIKDAYDDLSDLNSVQMDKVKEWELQFRERYNYVGRLIKPGEERTDYSEDEESEPPLSTKETDDSDSNKIKDD